MPVNIFSDAISSWSDLGIIGATLVIILIFVFFNMKSSNRTISQFAKINSDSINNLCQKIDKLTESNAEVTKTLAVTITKQTEDQQNNSLYLRQILHGVTETQGGIQSLNGKIDSLITMKCGAETHKI